MRKSGDEDSAPFHESANNSPTICMVADAGSRLVWSGHKDGKIRSWRMDQSLDGSSFKEGVSWQALRGPVLSMVITSYGDLWSCLENGVIKICNEYRERKYRSSSPSLSQKWGHFQPDLQLNSKPPFNDVTTNDEKRIGFVFVKDFRVGDVDVYDSAIQEAKSLYAIRTALENQKTSSSSSIRMSRIWAFPAFLVAYLCCSSLLLIATAQEDSITDPIEVTALQAIRETLNDPLNHLRNWNKRDPCTSNWTGVLCFNTTMNDGYLHVLELQLLNMNLSGTLSPELGRLSYMKILDFMWNTMTGSIPKEIGNISSLELLLLNGNKLTGSLPEEIGYLPNLDRIQIDQNQISGPLPKSFANLNKTKHFHMNNNSISGQIPPELSRQTNKQRNKGFIVSYQRSCNVLHDHILITIHLRGFLFIHFIRGLAVSGIVFGATIPVALIIDMFMLVTLHVSTLHWLLSILYSQQIEAIAALWRLFSIGAIHVMSFRSNAIDSSNTECFNDIDSLSKISMRKNDMRETGSSFLVSILHNNFLKIGEVVLPHYRYLFSGISGSVIASAASGVFTGKRFPSFLGSRLPSKLPWTFISYKEYWLLCRQSILACMTDHDHHLSQRSSSTYAT